jgi:hypothetical protein
VTVTISIDTTDVTGAVSARDLTFPAERKRGGDQVALHLGPVTIRGPLEGLRQMINEARQVLIDTDDERVLTEGDQ